MKTLRKSFFSLMLVILIKKKKKSKFSYCHTGLDAVCSTKESTQGNTKIKEIRYASTLQW